MKPLSRLLNRRLILAIFCVFTFFIINLIITPHALACSKGFTTTLQEDYEEADAIFTGKVDKLEEVYIKGRLIRQVTLDIVDTYKGKALPIVLTNLDSDQCGVQFDIGSTYLIYSTGVEHLYTNVFTTFNHLNADDRVAWLENRSRTNPVPHFSGIEKITAYSPHSMRIYFDRQPVELNNRPLIHNSTTFVPLDFIAHFLGQQVVWDEKTAVIDISGNNNELMSNNSGISNACGHGIEPQSDPFDLLIEYRSIRINMNGAELTGNEDPFILNNQVYIPLRAVAEKLGFEVSWGRDLFIIYVDHPLNLEGSPSPVLAMKFSAKFGVDTDNWVDALTDTTVTYRYFNYLNTRESDNEQHTVLFEEMIAPVEGWGFARYAIGLFLRTEFREIELTVSKELMELILTYPSLRKQLGTLLGKPITFQKNNSLLITLEDIQTNLGV